MWLTKSEQILSERLPNGAFSLGDLGFMDRRYAAELLGRLVRKGRVMRLRKGLFLNRTEIGGRDERLNAALAFAPGSYVAFASALKHYGLLSEELSRVFVATRGRRGLRDLDGFDVSFIPLGDNDFYGIVDEDGVFYSTLAKTFFDCLKKPLEAGGFGKIASALESASFTKHDWEELLYYLERSSKSLRQRAGFFFRERAPRWFLKQLGSSIGKRNVVVFEKGRKYHSEWGVYYGSS